MSSNWTSRLPEFQGTLDLEGRPLDIAEWDFGKIRRYRPLAVLRPAHVDDVVTAIQFCRREKVPLAARGHAHSAGGQMMVLGGLVLDMKSLDRILEITDDYIEVEAGISWAEVLDAAIGRGRTPPVVTDWLSVSVGGTVSMGGFGFMSFCRGTQMDHVLELEVVTGRGERRVCSPRRDKHLFDAVRGTHGQFALITRVRIPLEPAPPAVRMMQAAYGCVRSLLEDMRRITVGVEADLVHAFAAEKQPVSAMTRMNSTDRMALSEDVVEDRLRSVNGDWVYNLEVSDLLHPERTRPLLSPASLASLPGVVDVWELSWREFCFRLPPLILEEEFKGAAPHPELTVFLPLDDQGKDFVSREFERLHPMRDVGGGPVLLFPLDARLVSVPFLRLPSGEPYSFFLGLLRRAEPPTDRRVAALVDDNESIYSRALERGGVRYLPDTLPESRSFWRDHFRGLWPKLKRLKERFAPDGVLSSSFGMALLGIESGDAVSDWDTESV